MAFPGRPHSCSSPGPWSAVLRSVMTLGVRRPPRGSHPPHLWPGPCSGPHVGSSCPHSPTNSQRFSSYHSLVQNPHLVAGVHILRINPRPGPPASPAPRPHSEPSCVSASAPGRSSDVLCALCHETSARPSFGPASEDSFSEMPSRATPGQQPPAPWALRCCAHRAPCPFIFLQCVCQGREAAHGKITLVGQIRRLNTHRAGYRGR